MMNNTYLFIFGFIRGRQTLDAVLQRLDLLRLV